MIKKKTLLIGGLIVLSLGSVAYIYFISLPSQTQTPVNTWRGITPGQSAEEIVSTLGPPESVEKVSDSTELYSYDSGNNYHPHKVFVENQVSDLIIERNLTPTPGKLAEFLSLYGDPSDVLENQYSPVFYLYVYPQLGIAVNANQNDGAVRETWYFPPTTVEQFKLDYHLQIGEAHDEQE